MPPRRVEVPVSDRSEGTKRLSGDGALPLPAVASARRPHHLISRLHPPWGSHNGAAPRMSGATTQITISVDKDGRSGYASAAPAVTQSKATPHDTIDASHGRAARGRGVLATRANRNPRRRAEVTKKCTASRRSGDHHAPAAARKRPRSPLPTRGSAPDEADEDIPDSFGDVEARDDNTVRARRKILNEVKCVDTGLRTSETPPEVTQLSSSTSTSSSSISTSPPSTPLEHGARKGNDTRQGDTAGHLRTTTSNVAALADAEPHAAEVQNRHNSEVQIPLSPPTPRVVVEEVVISPMRIGDNVGPPDPPQNYTAASTADSKVLFAEEEEEGEECEGREGLRTTHRDAEYDGPQPTTSLQEDTHVLGSLSENAPIVAARPQAVQSHLQTLGDCDHCISQSACVCTANRDHVLLGEPPGARCGHPDDAKLMLDHQGAGVEQETNQQTCAVCTTPPSKPAFMGLCGGSVTPVIEGQGTCTAGESATFAETLAVQDLSLLPEDDGGSPLDIRGGAANGHECSQDAVLASFTPQHTPHSTTVAAEGLSWQRGAIPWAENSEDVLLGEGVVSPSVQQATVPLQPFTYDTEEVAEYGINARTGATEAAAGPSQCDRAVAVVSDSNLSTAFISKLCPAFPHLTTGDGTASDIKRHGSLSPPQFPLNAAASPTGAKSAPLRVSPTLVSPPFLPSSLPSTLDDGLWKESPSAGQAGMVNSGAVTPPRDTTNTQHSPESTALLAAHFLSGPHPETVPVDPFLRTPPQFKGAFSLKARDSSRGGGVSGGRSPPRSSSGRLKKADDPPAVLNSLSQAPLRVVKHSAAVDTSAVDLQYFAVGTRVEGRWGAQWFPAVIREAPRNGFVQIQWEEDGALLHVRLCEVRQLPGGTSTNGSVPESARNDISSSAVPVAKHTLKRSESGVLTATQLVSLMEEEDAEDSRQEPVPRYMRRSSPCGETVPLTGAPIDRQSRECGAPGMIESEGAIALPAPRTGYSREATEHSANVSHSNGDVNLYPENSNAPFAHDDNARTLSLSPASTSTTLQRPSGEVHPSSLCVFLSEAARRELLQGETTHTVSPPTSSRPFRYRAGPVTEMQRGTELERILHFLISAGAIVVESIAQADNLAAQIADNGEVNAAPVTRHTTSPAVEQRHKAAPPSAHGTKMAAVGANGSRNRKTVGRASLPRRCVMSAGVVASHAQRSATKYLIFLVSSGGAGVGGGLEESARLQQQQQDALSEVCFAHALGVSAIHASWLWSIAPGTVHITMPTEEDQVLRLYRESPETLGTKGTPQTGASPTYSPVLPLRFTPLAVQDRWLNAKDVAFVVRDDWMEMWLNAAGATVTAELAASQASHTSCQRLSRERDSASLTAAEALIGCSLGSAQPLCRPKSFSTPPLCKRPRKGRTPDFVYVPDDINVISSLDFLGSVPVLKAAWLAEGIEQHYRDCCNPSSPAGVVLPPPPSLASVWQTMNSTNPTKKGVGGGASTVSSADDAQSSSSASRRNLSRCEEKISSGSGGICGMEVVAASVLVNQSSSASCSDVDTVHPDSVHRVADCGEVGDDDAAPSGSLLKANGEAVGTELGDAVDAMGAAARHKEGDAPTTRLRVGSPLAVTALPSAGEVSNSGALDITAEATVFAEVEEDVIPRPVAGTAAAAMEVTDTLAPVKSSLCGLHPLIAMGEDYYFALSPSSPSPSLSHWSDLSFRRCSPLAIPTQAIVLGRVVDVQANGSPSPLQQQHFHADGAASSSTSSHRECHCLVTLQLYEPSYVSMHADPRTGEVVRQTKVHLAHRWVTVLGTSLDYSTPVYVISPAMVHHVYFLEEDGEGEEEGGRGR